MRRYVQYEPFDIYLFETDTWQHPVHTHSYFEIIFIRSGHGQHNVNGNTFAYGPGDVFLLGPADYHYFEIQAHTAFCYIRFTENYIKDQAQVKSSNLPRTIDFLLNTPYQAGGSIVNAKEEQEKLEYLLTVLLQEYSQRESDSYEQVINGIMQAILGILTRNLVRQQATSFSEYKKPQLIQEILVYIRRHIMQPELLRLEHLAANFNFSPGYASVYFKKETGESLQGYILKYKLKLIQNRLRFSDLSISQITHEFGFTDASHLHKLFKKYYGVGPQAFRQQKVINSQPDNS
ncbi:AraC family transcriptional regulator [Adhaeribacter rhizoryzae]|uniref:AraC family transcriptional regulator n=1 Tax=Adhaeribacter rhizoryzae TaxID=2607907 RepID=A0A5M6DSE4_9BACT|nr:AraC family transcriptional regulator [Adhaeribacter rhizoryzae]KAA5549159.1 AraC family transcriptional regulator [Adhaeribacter rhizoryzae]